MKLPGLLSRLGALPRVEVVLLAALVAVGIAGLLFSQAVSGAEKEQTTLEKRLAQARDDLASLRLANEKGQLAAQLETLEAQPGQGSNPSRQEALNRVSDLLAYAAQRQLRVSTFSWEDTLLTVGETKRPAVGLSLELEGSIQDLLGLLSVIDAFPGAALESVELSRSTSSGGQWGATLRVLMPYEGKA